MYGPRAEVRRRGPHEYVLSNELLQNMHKPEHIYKRVVLFAPDEVWQQLTQFLGVITYEHEYFME